MATPFSQFLIRQSNTSEDLLDIIFCHLRRNFSNHDPISSAFNVAAGMALLSFWYQLFLTQARLPEHRCGQIYMDKQIATATIGVVSLAPILTSPALAHLTYTTENASGSDLQFGLLAGQNDMLNSCGSEPEAKTQTVDKDPQLFFNVTSPSSTFICGSQGSGKSHTLACLLENCLIPSRAGRLSNPLTGLVFHYDTFICDTGGSPCEAAFLSWS
ncbi:hypothetical protein CIHG_10018 [Coccidioides immitis H538.4]|uniref:Uncharacterized protein n=2 Tax=Coccidioides immitis TaxID=5501 RepID=A0A0J8S4V5_COCIT|nr:hypothetical protein CIRG_05094 [Coccidioides immitis RMSCC 2394]KMU92157.1 hypothetical protein CIHG_10018 [Coccidioides immitis H538.4]